MEGKEAQKKTATVFSSSEKWKGYAKCTRRAGSGGGTWEEEIQELTSSDQGELNCLAPSTLGQEEGVEQLAKEFDLTLSSEDSAFECDIDDLL